LGIICQTGKEMEYYCQLLDPPPESVIDVHKQGNNNEL
jgi:hypothetical protein